MGILALCNLVLLYLIPDTEPYPSVLLFTQTDTVQLFPNGIIILVHLGFKYYFHMKVQTVMQ
jgi:hypothetical protein